MDTLNKRALEEPVDGKTVNGHTFLWCIERSCWQNTSGKAEIRVFPPNPRSSSAFVSVTRGGASRVVQFCAPNAEQHALEYAVEVIEGRE